MTNYESTSMFGTLLGVGIGALVPGGGVLAAALGGMLGGQLFGMFGSSADQRKEQRRLEKAQIKQANLLNEKIKADNANLYSSVQSATSQTSGAMGAVY